MSNMHIFNAGPCKLPDIVLEKTAEAINNFAGTGMSVLSISHRTKEWDAVMNETRALWKELLDIPDGYEVVFLSSGCTMEFLMVALNFLEKKAAYVDTGVWSTKALKTAKQFGEVVVPASSEDRHYCYVPKGYEIPTDVDYLHLTSNNTIYGTELRKDIDSPVPLICDMSSDIMTRPIDVSKYAMIYGGAQKNVGAAGVTFAIIKKDAIGKVSRKIPAILSLQEYIDKESMQNTPPVFAIYVMNQVLRWIKAEGGVKEMQRRAEQKAAALYAEIDRNAIFRGTADPEDRSLMNICFVLNDKYADLEAEFVAFCKERNIIGIKGHRLVGGFRASVYNACTMEDVQALIDAMQEFEKLHA